MKLIKKGSKRGVQTYLCKDCGKYFSDTRRTKLKLIKQLTVEYVFHKQTKRELSIRYKKDKRTITGLLNRYIPPNKKHTPRAVHLIVDATYFGERKEGNSWCIVVARDQYNRENLLWTFTTRETTSVYTRIREDLEKLGYTILSVTGDGFGGIRQAFRGIPYQMCQVHMERIVVRGTTRNPKTEAGMVLLALVKELKNLDSNTFRNRLQKYFNQYSSFLNEKTINTETGRKEWTHRELRKSALSLSNFLPFLFTYEYDNNIPKTTNSLEGHFRHINEISAIHCGLSRIQKEKFLTIVMLVGTIAPSEENVKKML